jgi:GTP-binding protein
MTLSEKNNSGKVFPSLILEATAFNKAQLIRPDAPQVAFVGRSNVGKSSLINALAGRKGLAKVSATPGKTRSINYYHIGASGTYLVDLPGYGYAQCSQEERNAWAKLMTWYLGNTQGLRGLIHLLDARLLPQKADLELLAYANSYNFAVLPILTKTDKCNKKELAICMRAWETHFERETLLSTSAKDKIGMEKVWEAVLRMLAAIR